MSKKFVTGLVGQLASDLNTVVAQACDRGRPFMGYNLLRVVASFWS